jgi:predicted SnoaL-like aldol condensation-catalyzing enzyme
MKNRSIWSLVTSVFLAMLWTAAAPAQERVVAAANPEALFTDKDPVLHRNKQAAYHIVKDLLEANQWQNSRNWLTDRSIQHNPLAGSGRAAVEKLFLETLKRKPSPVPEKMQTPVVAVVAQGDYVIVVYPRDYPRPDDASKTYSTTWFDMWRFIDGKADEHWDPATLPAAPAK